MNWWRFVDVSVSNHTEQLKTMVLVQFQDEICWFHWCRWWSWNEDLRMFWLWNRNKSCTFHEPISWGWYEAEMRIWGCFDTGTETNHVHSISIYQWHGRSEFIKMAWLVRATLNDPFWLFHGLKDKGLPWHHFWRDKISLEIECPVSKRKFHSIFFAISRTKFLRMIWGWNEDLRMFWLWNRYKSCTFHTHWPMAWSIRTH